MKKTNADDEKFKQFSLEINVKISRIEEKINYIIGLLETLFEEYDQQQLDEDINPNEGWINNQDFWNTDADEEY